MKQLKSLLGLLMVVAAFYVAWQVFPPYYSNFQFQDEIESATRLNSYNTKSEQEIKESLVKKARDLDIPITSDQIRVSRNGNELTISADYRVAIDLPVYPFELHFTPQSKNRKI